MLQLATSFVFYALCKQQYVRWTAKTESGVKSRADMLVDQIATKLRGIYMLSRRPKIDVYVRELNTVV